MKKKLILRDFLALDRTFIAAQRTLLAYLRTFAGLLGSGVGLTSLFAHPAIVAVGWVMIVCAPAALVCGLVGYFKIKKKYDVFLPAGKNLPPYLFEDDTEPSEPVSAPARTSGYFGGENGACENLISWE